MNDDHGRAVPPSEKRLVLGFDAGCTACSDLAERIERAAEDRLEVRSLRDPQVEHWRKQALGEDAPWAPTLIEVEGAEVKAWTGPRMGAALSRRLGLAATWRVMQALGEHRADTKRSAQRDIPAPAAGLSRSQFLKRLAGGLAGGLVAASVLPAGRASAAAQSGGARGVKRLSSDSDAVRRLKRFRSVEDANASFGVPDWGEVTTAKHTDRGEERTLYFVPYRKGGAGAAAATGTYLITEDESQRPDAASIALQAQKTGEGEGYLRYFTAEGVPLGALEVKDGRTKAHPPDQRVVDARCRTARGRCPRPGFARCFIACLGGNVSGDCAVNCFFCITGGVIGCAFCAYCAGPAGLRCARFCR